MLFLCKLDKCCCGCSLKTGSLILGIIDLILKSIVLIITFITIMGVLSDPTISDNTADGLSQDTLNIVRTIYITLCVLSGFMVIIDALLLIGITKSRPKLMVPWLILTMVYTVANVISSIIYASHFFENGLVGSGVYGLTYAFIFLGIKLYFLLVVYNYYSILKSEINQNNRINVTAYTNEHTSHAKVQQLYPNAQINSNLQRPVVTIEISSCL